jgi:predicted alpha-1,2-mannosidase
MREQWILGPHDPHAIAQQIETVLERRLILDGWCRGAASCRRRGGEPRLTNEPSGRPRPHHWVGSSGVRAFGVHRWFAVVASIVASLWLASVAGGVRSNFDPVALVDPMIGTDGNGHTFPGADLPFGMVQFSPVTVGGGPGGYQYSESKLSGFGVTRLSGAGCTNFGDVPLMPMTRPPRSSPFSDPAAFTDGFSHGHEVARPGSYQVRLSSGISVELSVTTRTGLGVFKFPRAVTQGTLVINPSASANHESATIQVVGRDEVVGSATSAAFAGACGHPPGSYTVYFALAFEHPFDRFGTWSGRRIVTGGRQRAGAHVGAFVSFDTRTAGPVRVKVGLSYVSVANARGNLATEATSWSFAVVQARARSQWDQLLQRIRVTGGSQESRELFYTALYHCLLHPNVFSDSNGEYIGGDGRIHVANDYTRYANFSAWDIYRSEMPLLAVLAPKQASDMIQSIVAGGEEEGQLPRWPVANAETGLMVGDPSDAIIADAYAFGARGFDTGLALREMLLGAGVPQPGAARPATVPTGYAERPALASYLSHGYIPGAASTTLEYAIADFAISQVANALGDQRDYQTLLARSGNWKQIFNPQTGFIEPRLASGSFPASFDPVSTTGFVEGNGAQYTLLVPQDMSELLAGIGPVNRTIQRLDSFFQQLNAGPDAPHPWLGNEPSLSTPYAYLWLNEPWRSEAVVRRALTSLFTAQPGGLPGNDDLGAISSWYVWNALGLYPVIPGVAGTAIVTPLFPSATITLANGARLQIRAAGAGPNDRYVQALTLDGVVHDASWLPLAQVAGGGTLDFTLGPRPSTWATGPDSTPPSFTTSMAFAPAPRSR